ncbi:rod shape-determining protein RodA [Aquimarina agarivorans]|uniref:rod shape-determining protein RodA n=1 Tax=Aquimarina agarivorans TaxID=980584 RepID=UPI000248F5EB|nr:rod shape-determining protein RodA [Aquimarina agarivorans]
MSNSNLGNIDWVSILVYFLLVIFGWVNIYSASLSEDATSYFDLNQPYGKQALWIGLSIFFIIIILATESKFFERFSSIIYIVSLISLLGLFVFGKTISGATSWYVFGGISIQPSEFAKTATALALAKYISDLQTNIKRFNHQIKAFLILILPALLIIGQPDAGSALVYAAFVFTMYREGITGIYLFLGFLAVTVFVLTLLFGATALVLTSLFVGILVYFFTKNKKNLVSKLLIYLAGIALFSFSVNYVFNNVFKQHHRDRFNIVLGKKVDAKGIGYNTNQSEIAIGSGGWFGTGWTQGTQTKGGFVPEQHTDYIFSTVGEEWGFVGSVLVILLFSILIIRALYIAERQRSQFSRVYCYSVASILFIHFFVNVGMVIGVVPTVGIPLPFFSYGGSGLWGFTMLVFIMIKLDADRMKKSF